MIKISLFTVLATLGLGSVRGDIETEGCARTITVKMLKQNSTFVGGTWYTKADFESHWQKSAPVWVNPFDHYISCVDARNSERTIATPGGDIAEFLMGFHAHVEATGRTFSNLDNLQTFVDTKLKEYIDKYITPERPFFYHTAQDKLDNALKYMGVKTFPATKPSTNFTTWLDALSMATAQGCGHLRYQMLEATQYHVVADYIRATIKAMFKLYFDDNYQDKILIHNYQFYLTARGVMLISNKNESKVGECFEHQPLIAPTLDLEKVSKTAAFVYHTTHGKKFREEVTSKFFGVSAEKLDEMADHQFEETAHHIAAWLPIAQFEIDSAECKIDLHVKMLKDNATFVNGTWYTEQDFYDHIVASVPQFVDPSTQTISCVDARNPDPTIGSAGGDFAEFLMGLNLRIGKDARIFTTVVELEDYVDEQLKLFIDTFCSEVRPFFFHTAQDKLNIALAAMNMKSFPETVPNNFTGWLDALSMPTAQGCGHIRYMMLESTEYKMDTSLVRACIKALYKLFYNEEYNAKILIHNYQFYLKGRGVFLITHSHDDHADHGSTEVNPCKKLQPLIRGTVNSETINQGSAFIYHEEYLTTYREEVIATYFDIAPEKLVDLAEHQFHLTAHHVAAWLPIAELEIGEHVPEVPEVPEPKKTITQSKTKKKPKGTSLTDSSDSTKLSSVFSLTIVLSLLVCFF